MDEDVVVSVVDDEEDILRRRINECVDLFGECWTVGEDREKIKIERVVEKKFRRNPSSFNLPTSFSSFLLSS